jgi:hypothetical protein
MDHDKVCIGSARDIRLVASGAQVASLQAESTVMRTPFPSCLVAALLYPCALPGRAESGVTAARGTTPAVGHAHLDFRVTVLPALGARVAADGSRVAAGNLQALAITTGTVTVWQLQPPRQLAHPLRLAAPSEAWTLSAP